MPCTSYDIVVRQKTTQNLGDLHRLWDTFTKVIQMSKHVFYLWYVSNSSIAMLHLVAKKSACNKCTFFLELCSSTNGNLDHMCLEVWQLINVSKCILSTLILINILAMLPHFFHKNFFSCDLTYVWCQVQSIIDYSSFASNIISIWYFHRKRIFPLSLIIEIISLPSSLTCHNYSFSTKPEVWCGPITDWKYIVKDLFDNSKN